MALVTLAGVLLSGCSVQSAPETEPLLMHAQELANETGCTDQIDLHADLSSYSRVGGVSCELNQKPVIVRVYESTHAAVRALNDLAPLAVNGIVAVTGDKWVALIPETIVESFVVGGPGRSQLSADELVRAENVPTNDAQDDLDFCVRWSTSQLQAWVEGDNTTSTTTDIPPQLRSADAAVSSIKTQQQENRQALKEALDSNLWMYESRISETLSPVRAACAESFPSSGSS